MGYPFSIDYYMLGIYMGRSYTLHVLEIIYPNKKMHNMTDTKFNSLFI